MMDLEITKERETPLLERTRISAKAHFDDKTPTRAVIQKKIADKLKKDPKLVIVRHVYQRYGKKEAKVIAHVYDKEDNIVKLEGQKLIDKHNKEEPKVEAKAEEKPAEVATEAPAEPAKEEPKTEEKKEEAPAKEEPKTEEKKEEAPAKEEPKPASESEKGLEQPKDVPKAE